MLKTNMRNSTSENRLVDLALLNILRNIFITDDMVLDNLLIVDEPNVYNLLFST
jgi:hypothetical protein